MTQENLAPWIEKLNKAEPKDRKAIVGEMCKENGVKVPDAWKLLKEAGYDSGKADPPSDETNPDSSQQGGTEPDSTDSAPAAGADTPKSGNAPPIDEAKPDTGNQGNETPPAKDQKPEKKRVRHEKLKGKNLIVGSKTIAFDADGIAELDTADADRLLTIPGYTAIRCITCLE